MFAQRHVDKLDTKGVRQGSGELTLWSEGEDEAIAPLPSLQL